MPRFSAFSRFGHLRFSSRPSHAELIYRDIRANLNGAFDEDFDGVAMAGVYADAMALARAKYTVERAGNQFRPQKAREMLPALERDHGLVPGPRATVPERQAEVAAAAKIARGARRSNVEDVLREILGDDFVAYIPTSAADAENSSGDPATVGTWERPGAPKAVYRTTGAVSTLNSPVVVAIEHVAGHTDGFRVGQTVTLDVGNYGRAESVSVLGYSATAFVAEFTKPHDVGTSIVLGRAPNLSSTKRHNTIILSDAAMRDAEKLRNANRVLRKLVRGVSTWDLIAPPAETGPFLLGPGAGAGLLSHTPLGPL